MITEQYETCVPLVTINLHTAVKDWHDLYVKTYKQEIVLKYFPAKAQLDCHSFKMPF